MRTLNSIKNIIISLSLGVVATLVGFVSQRVFIDQLGIEYMGVNALFTSIITMLAVAELGIGSAVIYHLYRPLAEGRSDRIKSLMSFYKLCYRIIAGIIAIAGTILLPFVPLMTGRVDLPVNLYIIFSLFILDACLSYLMSYKRSILYADQKNYIISVVRIGSTILMSALQIGVLLITQNFFMYLIIKILFTVIENLVLNRIVSLKYQYLSGSAEVIDGETRSDILLKAKGLLFHKLGTFAVVGTDNIVISLFFGIKIVGLYSNYLFVINALSAIFTQLTTALAASVGSLLIDDNKRQQRNVFENIFFANLVLSVLASVAFFIAINPLVSVWLGNTFLLPLDVTAVLSFSLFLTMMRMPIQTFKTAAGIFHEDRYMPVLEAVINLVGSLILLHIFGLAGVFMGTVLSTLFLHAYSYPKYTYSKLFNMPWSSYWLMVFRSVIILVISATISYMLVSSISLDGVSQLIASVILSLIVCLAIISVFSIRAKESKYFLSLIRKFKRRMMKK